MPKNKQLAVGVLAALFVAASAVAVVDPFGGNNDTSPPEGERVATVDASAMPGYTMVDGLFGKFTYPYKNKTWRDGSMVEDGVKNIVISSHCGLPNDECPNMYIVDLASEYGKKYYGDKPLESAVSAASCSLTDTPASEPLVAAGEAVLGDSPAQKFTQQVCTPTVEVPVPVERTVWYSPKHELLVWVMGTYAPVTDKDISEIETSLAGFTRS